MTAADRPSEPSGQPCNGRSQCSRSADGTKTPSPSIPGSSWAGWHKRAIICDGAGSVASPLLASPADGGVPRPSPVHCVIVSWANATVGLDARRRQGLATRAQMSPGLGIVRLSIFSIKTSQKLFNIPGFVLEAAIEKEKKRGLPISGGFAGRPGAVRPVEGVTPESRLMLCSKLQRKGRPGRCLAWMESTQASWCTCMNEAQ